MGKYLVDGGPGHRLPAGKTGFDMSILASFKDANGSLRGALGKAFGFLGFDMLAGCEGGVEGSQVEIVSVSRVRIPQPCCLLAILDLAQDME